MAGSNDALKAHKRCSVQFAHTSHGVRPAVGPAELQHVLLWPELLQGEQNAVPALALLGLGPAAVLQVQVGSCGTQGYGFRMLFARKVNLPFMAISSLQNGRVER